MDVLRYDPLLHQEYILGWWEAREGLAFDHTLLPKTGLVAYDDRPVAALFAYLSDTRIAWLAWPIAAPDSSKEERDLALDLLFVKLEDVIKELGYDMIITTSRHKGVESRLLSHGYTLGDTNVTQYLKGIK